MFHHLDSNTSAFFAVICTCTGYHADLKAQKSVFRQGLSAYKNACMTCWLVADGQRALGYALQLLQKHSCMSRQPEVELGLSWMSTRHSRIQPQAAEC